VALPLAAFSAVFLWDGPPPASGFEAGAAIRTATDRETAHFGQCSGPVRINCVVDGDTFWYRGEKIRIADINTPEVSEPGCAREASLGGRATRRLQDLLNDGAFSLEADPSGRDTDRYGRALRTVHRDGESIGKTLVSEGLAETWKGRRSSWC
jgi:endonuclease YncB( thermonuclease family)